MKIYMADHWDRAITRQECTQHPDRPGLRVLASGSVVEPGPSYGNISYHDTLNSAKNHLLDAEYREIRHAQASLASARQWERRIDAITEECIADVPDAGAWVDGLRNDEEKP